ncbi:MAG: bifunctional metallophosphatase/5'-nucleotidase [Bacteroidales bacterium]|nr:bifunctional metallophosphatase/5'-nucleotidase [Bacteroidales bacterium]
MRRFTVIALFLSLVLIQGCSKPRDGVYAVNILALTDVHGKYFDSTYVGAQVNDASLSKVSTYLKKIRLEDPQAIVIDNGDNVQGDNAAYFHNYVAIGEEHLYGKIAKYLGYDALIPGNHDVEAGHPVYDRIRKETRIPMLAANTPVTGGTGAGKPYFDEYTVLKRNGLKIAVIGLTNPNIKSWIAPGLYSGFDFLAADITQELVDRVKGKENPDVVVVSIHGGTGEGLSSDFENPALYLAENLRGVDLVICGHDHRATVREADNPYGKVILLNPGSHARNVGHATATLEFKDGVLVSKNVEAELVPTAPLDPDPEYDAEFYKDYLTVKSFTVKKVCMITEDIDLGDVLDGPSKYVNLLHDIMLSSTGAQVSFAAPLGRTSVVKAGDLIYNDLFTLYPYENQLYVVHMTGEQIVNYLEYSYDNWINRRGPAYNYDSAKGFDYKVYLNRPYGSRIEVISMSDGTPFDYDRVYDVAMTSYRASGGGDLLKNGAGIDVSDPETYTIAKYPEIRDLLYNFFMREGTVTPQKGSNWCFVK